VIIRPKHATRRADADAPPSPCPIRRVAQDGSDAPLTDEVPQVDDPAMSSPPPPDDPQGAPDARDPEDLDDIDVDDFDAREAARLRRRDHDAGAERRDLMRPGMGKVFKQIGDRWAREARGDEEVARHRRQRERDRDG
jgi:hypothetical protein